jgi:hypothetical protein
VLRSDLIPNLLKSGLWEGLTDGSFLRQMVYELANNEKGIISTLSGTLCNILMC